MSFQRSRQLYSASPINQMAFSYEIEEVGHLSHLQVFLALRFRRLEISVFVLLLEELWE